MAITITITGDHVIDYDYPNTDPNYAWGNCGILK